MLLALESKGVIKLPARLRVRESFNRRCQTLPDLCEIDQEEFTGKVSEFRSLTIEMVRFTPEEKLWDHLVHTCHYLGHPWIVGSYLKYLAYLDGRLVACLGWGSASWKVACRDSLGISGTWSEIASFIVTGGPLEAPVPSCPPDSSRLGENRPAFSWSPVEGASGYRLQVSENGFSTCAIDAQTETAFWLPACPLRRPRSSPATTS